MYQKQTNFDQKGYAGIVRLMREPHIIRHTESIEISMKNSQIDIMAEQILNAVRTSLPRLKSVKLTASVPHPEDKDLRNPWPTMRMDRLVTCFMAFDSLKTLTFDIEWVNTRLHS